MHGVFGLITVAVIGISVAIAIPNLLSAVQRGRQKTTMERMRIIGERIEHLKNQAGFPVLRSIDPLGSKVETLPTLDGWNRPYKLISDPWGYFIVSAGKDGQFEQTDPKLYQSGPTLQSEEDIVYSNGRFIRKPEGL